MVEKTGRDLQPSSVVRGANRRLTNGAARMRGGSVRIMDDSGLHAATGSKTARLNAFSHVGSKMYHILMAGWAPVGR
jgi:hypothetical protein